jgi:hypothetical protein
VFANIIGTYATNENDDPLIFVTGMAITSYREEKSIYAIIGLL